MAIGRISGPLLKSNLLREGVNLAFETDLLYLDVNNSRIGINVPVTTNPDGSPNTDDITHDLTVGGTVRAPQFEVATEADIADINFFGNTISTNANVLTLGTADNVIYQNKLVIDSIDLEDNIVSTNETNANLEFSPNGSGSVEIFADTNVYGNITATGSITADGNITIGDADTDNVTFNADIASDIIPDSANTYSLGGDPDAGGKQWSTVFANDINADIITTDELIVDGIDLALRQGNIFYVAENGDDTHSGTHPNDPYGSLSYALTQASAGDTIHIYPGEFQEVFPMTVPVGVTVKGHSIRSVKIKPTVGTQSNSAFLLNGESTVEDITIADFYAPGYAFEFANNFTVTTRSPYVRNISVITKGSVTTGADPRGFDEGDAGGGAYLDGSLANSASREAGMLFHSVTFITPGVDAITITNGTRVEWLNSFTYFASKGLYAVDGITGLKGTGQTALRVSGVANGSIANGDTITYYDADGTTVLATGIINGLDADGKFYIDGKESGFELFSERLGKTVQVFDDARLDTSFSKFGGSSLQLDGTSDYLKIDSNNDFGFGPSPRIAKTINTNGNVSTSTPSAFGSQSLRFDGTGDYLDIASSNDFAFGTDDFTLEMWVYKTADTGQESILDFRSSATDVAIALGVRNGNKPYVYVNGAYEISSATAITLSSWNHIAYVREGTTGTLYLNGVSVGSWTDNSNYSARPLVIGALYDGTALEWTGNLDSIRVSKDLARYTGAFTVPTVQFVDDIYTVLLLHGNGSTDDTAPDSTVNDFTVEAWIYKSADTGVETILDFRAGTSVDNAVTLGIDGLQPYVYINGVNRIQAGSNITTGQWTHIAYSRRGYTGRLFVDGTSVGSWTDTINYGIQKPLVIGADYTGTSSNFTGWIDELRVSTEVSRYNNNFAVQTGSFSSDNKTVLLLHFDGADSSLVIEDDSQVSQDIRFGNGATANFITLADFSDFGGEIRSIASACVYGNYGAYGDGQGVLMYLISQNFAYIGLGRDEDNDNTTVIQENEVVELNDAKVRYTSVDHKGDFRVGDLFYVNQETGEVNFTSTDLNIETSSGISITTNGSTTNITGEFIDTGNLRFSENTISSTGGDIFLDAESGTVRINSTGAIKLADGTTAERPAVAEQGMIRYNTDNNLFEGYDGDWIALNGVYDLDLDTRITAELTPGANDGIIRFYIEDEERVSIDAFKLETPRIEVDDISIDGNVIRTETTDTDLLLSAAGTGAVVVDDIAIKDSTITNRAEDSILYFQQEGSGYFKIDGTAGFVVPVGTSLERPASAYRETGMTRFNTQQGYLEIWDGFSWVSVAGATGAITVNAAEDLSIEYVLTLG